LLTELKNIVAKEEFYVENKDFYKEEYEISLNL
jgi:hypothetical protein